MPMHAPPVSARLTASLLLLAAAAVAGCSPTNTDPASRIHADGDRGSGWFVTAWGTEHLDYEWHHGERVYDGDLVLDPGAEAPAPVEGRAQEPLLSRASARWAMDPSGVVTIPYEIDNTGGLGSTLYDRTSHRIRKAMDHWQSYALRPDGTALLRFVPHAGQARWVQFQVKHNGGFCYVALHATGKSRVDADPVCLWQTFVHELGHVLTFRHEQKRSDRPGHVIFHADRTNEDAQYTMVRGGNTLGTPYDSHSIMHYPSCMFALASTCNARTPLAWVLERTTDPPYIDWWRHRAVDHLLSQTDLCGTRRLYGLSCAGLDVGGSGSSTGGGDAGVGVVDDAGIAGAPEAGAPEAGAPDAMAPAYDQDGGEPCASPSACGATGDGGLALGDGGGSPMAPPAMSAGGCDVSGGGTHGAAVWLAGLALLGAIRRRRRRGAGREARRHR